MRSTLLVDHRGRELVKLTFFDRLAIRFVTARAAAQRAFARNRERGFGSPLAFTEVSVSSPMAIPPTPIAKVETTVDFALAAWNTVATHEVFTVAGMVSAMEVYRVTERLVSGGAPTISFGREGSTAQFAAAQVHTNLVAPNFVNPGGTVATQASFDTYQARAGAYDFLDGLDLGYEILTAAMTDGTIVAACYWTPISPGASVVSGAGGVL